MTVFPCNMRVNPALDIAVLVFSVLKLLAAVLARA